jgi:phenylalanyl-tRNA synthetase beta chain
MRFSESWLREWVNPAVDTHTLADQLSMAGLEVDAVEPAALEFTGVVVGHVISVDAHPNAEKLRVCRVDVGEEESLQIICGASNVAEGMKVAIARIGARLPGDLKIKRAKLRGVESFGMICSAAELGLTESSSGIMELPEGSPVGEDLRVFLALDDRCIELDLTPDRSDCLSVAGVAREVAVINRTDLRVPAIGPVSAVVEDGCSVELEAPDACPRYACRVILDIDYRGRTPLWMRERLRRSGLRSINPVVDVTNYVMLELGQPMHGFDLGQLHGGIRVRMARSGEQLELLTGERIDLREDTLVIADAARPVALAGIMGGAPTGVTDETRNVLVESAFFAPQAIIGKARSYGLHTDSSHRFERGVDPQLQVEALERATGLLLEICGGRPGPVVEEVAPGHLPTAATLRLRRARVRRVLGMRLDDGVIEDILSRLGARLIPTEEGWDVIVPTRRFDLVLEEDLIAEIGRIYGYKDIPISHASVASATKAPPEAAFDLNRGKLLLVDRGYQEVITYSFVGQELQQKIDPGRPALSLANPLSSDMSIMRTSLWPGLLQVARYNLARQQERVRIFESGLRFQDLEDGLHQDMMLAGLLMGSVAPEQWGQPVRRADFFDAKSDVEALLSPAGKHGEFRFVPGEHPALHPGQTALVQRRGGDIGVVGMLHPALALDLGVVGDAYLFEVLISGLDAEALPAFESVSRFPLIRRDIAILVPEELPYQRVYDCIAATTPDLLKEVKLFDVYQGDKIDSGLKSLALGLILQASSQTLTVEGVDEVITRVLERLKAELGARLRD